MEYLAKYRSGSWRLLVTTAVVALVCAVSVASAAGPGVHGRVFGQNEKGKFAGLVSGADIEIKDQAGSVVAQTTADQNGYYKINLPPGQYFYKLQAPGYKNEDAGRAIRLNQTEGYAVFHFSLTKGENDPDRKPPELPVATIGKLHGRVLEKTDQGELGIAGAVLLLKREGSRRLIKVVTRGLGKEGNNIGYHEVTLEAGTYQVSVLARGFERFIGSEPVQITAGADVTRDFVLTRYQPEPATEQGIQGRVILLDSGEPISSMLNLDVRLFSLPSRGGEGKPVALDARGGFKLDLPVGRYRLVANAKGFKTAQTPPTYVIPKKYSHVKLALEPGTDDAIQAYEVLVVDAKTRAPLPDAMLETLKQGAPPSAVLRSTTDAHGLALLQATSGPHSIQTRLEGYEPNERTLDLDPRKQRIHVEMYREKPDPSQKLIHVVVTVIDGTMRSPLADASVLLRKGDKLLTDSVRGITDSKGTLTLRAADAGNYTVLAQAKGYQPGGKTLHLEFGQTYEAEIRLVQAPGTEPGPSEGTLDLSILGMVKPPLLGPWNALPDADVKITRNGLPVATGRSDSRGAYSINLGPGTYDIEVTHVEFQPARDRVTLSTAGATRRIILERAAPEPSLVNVSGQVLMTSKRPGQFVGIPGAEVLWIREDNVAKAQGDTSGKFGIQLPADNYRVTVKAEGFEDLDAKIGVRAGMSPVRLVLNRRTEPGPSEGTLDLSILGMVKPPLLGPWNALPDADVKITRNGLPVATGRSDSRGAYSINLGPGTYDIEVTHVEFQPARDRVTLSTAGATRRIILERVPEPSSGKKTLTVRVVQPSIRPTARPLFMPSIRPSTKPPISGAQVTVMQGSTRVATGNTDANGYYRVTLSPGNYSVKASAKGYNNGGSTVTIGTSDVGHEIVLTKTSEVKPPSGKKTLTVRVVQPSIRPTARPLFMPSTKPSTKPPISGAQVTVMQGSTRVATGNTDANGYYRITLSPGKYSINASAKGFRSGNSTVTIGTSDVGHEIVLTKTSEVKPPSGKKTLTVRVAQPSIRPTARPSIRPLFMPSTKPSTKPPISGAQVTIMQGSTRVATGKTDANGYYRITLSPGKYSINASAKGFRSGSSTVTIGTSDVEHEIVLAKTSGNIKPPSGKKTLTVRVVQPSIRPTARPLFRPSTKSPIPGAEVTVMQGSTHVATGKTDASGHYRVTLSPGNYSVKASAKGYNGRSMVTIGTSDVTREIAIVKTASPIKPPSLQEINSLKRRAVPK